MNTNVGIISCSFILKHIKSVLGNKEGFKIYPLVPACLFNVSPSLLRHVFDQASMENRTSLVAYGYCHKDLPLILEEYKDFAVKIPGDNCWEMLLGRPAFRDYVDEGCWLLRTAVCNEWRSETFLAYGASSITDNLVKGCNTKKITACRFEPEKPRDSEVYSFAQAFETPSQIVDCKLTHFSALIEQGISAARQLATEPTKVKTLHAPEKRVPQIPNEIGEIAFQFDICSKTITFISPKVTQLLGFTPSEFVNYFVTDPNHYYYYDRDTQEQIVSQRYSYISNCISKGMQLPLAIEYKAKRKDGEVIWIKEHIYPRYNQDGSVNTRFRGKLEDISYWKGIECNLKHLYEQEASAKTALQNEITKHIDFTRALVHELKTPLTPILLASDALANNIGDKQWLPLIDCINKGAADLSSRIDEILDLAKGEVGILKIECSPFDINELVEETAHSFKLRAVKNKQLLRLMLDKTIPLAIGESKRIKQVLMNLIDNAIKYSGERATITLTTGILYEKVLVIVQDDGPGISKERQQDLFIPYRCTNNLSGLGIGLALSKKIVELHGGKVWVVTNQGSGCAFYFTVPAKVIPNNLKVANESLNYRG
ncbi:PAS domain-containing sensor histidine kinase [Dehalogenimonas alkenigignens]|uniref:PAS domain-containing sensor histidine kinase n=1 Tax=Dehalogenimonas alkenigignens TaxID=1217799 RepID=UPI000D585A37|nr:PAS domain-containing sensor histidine kinase [Dehalogenimonas alkenigignens]PVV82611.1 ATPase [Dehalogenimonas alkenigignens]